LDIQFLIGRLKTSSFCRKHQAHYQFQFLIGRLKT